MKPLLKETTGCNLFFNIPQLKEKKFETESIGYEIYEFRAVKPEKEETNDCSRFSLNLDNIEWTRVQPSPVFVKWSSDFDFKEFF